MSAAQQNAQKIQRILENRDGSAVLYRTTVAGPSGQRKDTPVARVSYTWEGAYELKVWCPLHADCQCDEPAGYLTRSYRPGHAGQWAVRGTEPDSDGYWLKGWADSPAIGADILINGEHAANGNHDSARTSRGGWHRYEPAA